MAWPSSLWLALVCVAVTAAGVWGQSTAACSKVLLLNRTLRDFTACTDLVAQGAKLSWTYDLANGTVSIGFQGSTPSSSGWVGWGLNPTQLAMVGTSTLIAFQAGNGSNVLPYLLTHATVSSIPLQSGPIDYETLEKDVQISGTSITIYAKLKLHPNESIINLVWNRGSSVNNFQPSPHGFGIADLQGLKRIDLRSGTASGIAPPHQHLKNRHGIINAVAWGILFPLGVICARYIKPVADPAWFYLHISFQCAGYAVGVAGWATGLKLGGYSPGVVYHRHRNVGITLFAMSTLQVMALLLRPDKGHRIRKCWNVYHRAVGYSLIALGILNIFFGLAILSPPKRWHRAYYGTLAALGGATIALEIAARVALLRRGGDAPGKPPLVNRASGSSMIGLDGRRVGA